jgi:hypothetical protein
MVTSKAKNMARVDGVKLSEDHSVLDDEGCGVIEYFFYQLWWVPQSPPSRVSHHPSSLFWIHRDLWEGKLFKVGDFVLVHDGDVLKEDPKELCFARNI